MRTLLTLAASWLILAGCVAMDALQSGPGAATGAAVTAPAASIPTPDPAPAPTLDLTPKMITPATGGPPVLATPMGGNIYAPVTGGPPVFGIPLFP
jgi:hypothetical protein